MLEQKSSSSDTREILFDAFRFTSRHYDVIKRSALHLYHSALPFTPTKNRLSNVYINDNLRRLGGGPERWDALVAFANHDDFVYRIAFSLDRSLLASWGTGEMKLLDAASGIPVKTFKGDKFALARDFSAVALSRGGALALYDVSSSASVANYIPSAKVVELALSFDGSRLAVGLLDGTVSLWDRGRDEPIAKLGGYARNHGRLEFSPASYHLAFLSDDSDIRLWDGFKGGFIATLCCKSMHVEFVFSHSGSRLAALTKRNDLTLWNGENGKLIGMAMGAGQVLAISDDGSLIATGRLEVQLWSGTSLSLIDTLKIGDPDWIYSLALSHDTLAIGFEKEVALYDLQTRTIITSVKFPEPDPLALSSTRLVANNHYQTQLWDVQNMKASAPESTKIPRIVTALAFSPNCSRLASGFKDGTVEIWDTCRTEDRKSVV